MSTRTSGLGACGFERVSTGVLCRRPVQGPLFLTQRVPLLLCRLNPRMHAARRILRLDHLRCTTAVEVTQLHHRVAGRVRSLPFVRSQARTDRLLFFTCDTFHVSRCHERNGKLAVGATQAGWTSLDTPEHECTSVRDRF